MVESADLHQDWVIYVDTDLLVVNKPAGLPTLVDGYDPQAPYLVGLLKQVYDPVWVVHRLDRGASGVIAFARTAGAHRALNCQFEMRQVEKIYHALAQGSPDWERYSVDLPLRPNGDRRHRTIIDHRRGKPSLTELRVLERFGAQTHQQSAISLQYFSLIEARPKTGRPHQIRAHLAALGHPLASDALYGGAALDGLERIGLHAYSLTLSHPSSGKTLTFSAPYSDDIRMVLERLHRETQNT